MPKPRESRRLRSVFLVLVVTFVIAIAVGVGGAFSTAKAGTDSAAAVALAPVRSAIALFTGPGAAVRRQDQRLLQELHQLQLK